VEALFFICIFGAFATLVIYQGIATQLDDFKARARLKQARIRHNRRVTVETMLNYRFTEDKQ